MISIKVSINNNVLGLQNLMQILDDLRGCVSLNAWVIKGRKKHYHCGTLSWEFSSFDSLRVHSFLI